MKVVMMGPFEGYILEGDEYGTEWAYSDTFLHPDVGYEGKVIEERTEPLLISGFGNDYSINNNFNILHNLAGIIDSRMDSALTFGDLKDFRWSSYRFPPAPRFRYTREAIQGLKTLPRMFQRTNRVISRGLRFPRPPRMPTLPRKFYVHIPSPPNFQGHINLINWRVREANQKMRGVGSRIGKSVNRMIYYARQYRKIPEPKWEFGIFRKIIKAINHNLHCFRKGSEQLGIGLKEFVKGSKAVTYFFENVPAAVAGFIKAIPGKFKVYFRVLFNNLKNSILKYGKQLGNVVKTVWAGLKQYIKNVGTVVEAFISRLISAIQADITEIVTSIRKKVLYLAKCLQKDIAELPKYMENVVKGLQNNITSNISKLTGNIRQEIEKYIKGFKSWLKDTEVKIKKRLEDIEKKTRKSIAKVYSDLNTKLTRAYNDMNAKMSRAFGDMQQRMKGLEMNFRRQYDVAMQELRKVSATVTEQAETLKKLIADATEKANILKSLNIKTDDLASRIRTLEVSKPAPLALPPARPPPEAPPEAPHEKPKPFVFWGESDSEENGYWDKFSLTI